MYEGKKKMKEKNWAKYIIQIVYKTQSFFKHNIFKRRLDQT